MPKGRSGAAKYIRPGAERRTVPVRFSEKLDRLLARRDSLLCVGLDPDPTKFPRPVRRAPAARRLRLFDDGIVRATRDHAVAYKMQLGAFLPFGAAGIAELERLARTIGSDRLRILDLKANDIPNTMRLYQAGAFGRLGFDAITVTPWLGWETFGPLLEDPAHGFFVVAHSSNPGAPDFQEIPTPRGPLWQAVVGEVKSLAGRAGNAGVVVGATFAEAVRQTRQIVGNGLPILVPGVGALGGALSTIVRDGVDARGRALLVSASRSILYASAGPDWANAAGEEARRLSTQINQLRAGVGTTKAGRR
jgi:orotidine-5'-phosphate decarboxylase